MAANRVNYYEGMFLLSQAVAAGITLLALSGASRALAARELDF